MKTVIVTFQNHFDLLWRRCWERDYEYQGERFASYARVEEACTLRWLDLAERGRGAFVIEQALTMRMLLKKHPTILPRLKRLFAQGLFDVQGSGEAIIDVNMCSPETMARNMASGTEYCRRVLGIMPLWAGHADGFGSSAQFPQIIRGCGYAGVMGLSYCTPDNRYWRGLDGTTVLIPPTLPGRNYFFDHCYHEPCRVCHGHAYESCDACEGTGFDLPQNFYPPFQPVDPGVLTGETGQYIVSSEEMLPPAYLHDLLLDWQKANPGIRYVWGTMRRYADLWTAEAARVDNPPAERLASRVENVPVQTGCYTSRIACKLLARQLEAAYYGWEKALMATCPQSVDRAWLEERFLELPLAFFHDSVTGTQMDEAHRELVDRMTACMAELRRGACETLSGQVGRTGGATAAGLPCAVFNPHMQGSVPVRAPLPDMDWRTAESLVAVDAEGRRHPVVHPFHAMCPALPPVSARLIDPVGPAARTRPAQGTPRVECSGVAPVAWSALRLEKGCAPEAVSGRMLENGIVRVTLGDAGVDAIEDISTGRTIRADGMRIGEILLEEDEGDPWGIRKIPSFRKGLAPFTKFLGATRFDGYVEAWYGGRYEPNLVFAKEEDARMFSLEWYVTVRLLDGARRVDYAHEIFWKTVDRRLRIVFPTQAATDAGFYSIPGGWLRRERYEQKETGLISPNGDWPAVYFHATTDTRSGAGWALVNYGTPAARIEDGRLMTSVLRSIGFGHALERYGQTYPMPTSGLRDGGWHRFEFSLLPHEGEADMPRVSMIAAALNQPAPVLPGVADMALASLFTIDGADVELLAVKPAFDPARRDVAVIRVANSAAGPRTVRIRRADSCPLEAVETSLIEECEGPMATHPDGFALALGAFGIRSVMVRV